MKEINKLFDLYSGNENFCLPQHDYLFTSLVRKSAKYLQAHESMVAMGLLGALSCAAQGGYDVARPSGEKNLPVSLYLLTIADPSERKTSVEEYFFEVLRTFEQEKLDRYNDDIGVHEAAYKLWKLKKKGVEKAYEKALKDGDKNCEEKYEAELIRLLSAEPDPPINPRFIYDDTTPEALLESMHNNRPLACLVTSEANSVLNGRALTALHHINNLWGKSGAKVDRTSKPSFSLGKNARLTLALMTQGSVVEHFIDSKGEKAKGTGFMSRMLVCTPPRLSGTRSYSLDDEVSRPEVYDVYRERILKLLKQTDAVWGSKSTEDPVEPELLEFNEYAKKQWRDYAKQIEERQRVDGIYYFASDHAGKIMENTTRIAALLHLLEREGVERHINERTLEAAYHLVLQLSANYMTCFTPKPDIIKRVDRFVQYVFKSTEHDDLSQGYRIDREDILRKGPIELRRASELDKVIRILDKMAHIEWLDKTNYRSLMVLPLSTPQIKNGYGFIVDSLPPFQRLRKLTGLSPGSKISQKFFLYSDDEDEKKKEDFLIDRLLDNHAEHKYRVDQRDMHSAREFSEIGTKLEQEVVSKNSENIKRWVQEFTG